jgi:hypothetical protein
MSDGNEHWNPEDGPPPTEEERAEARALAEALAAPAEVRAKSAEPDLDALVGTALRVRATAHPDAARARAIAAAAVAYAVTHAGQRWYRTRWRWVALLAAALVGIGGAQLALFRPRTETEPTISHPATDVFTAPLPHDARSAPIGRLTDARMRAYRDTLFSGRASGRRSP